VIGCIRFDSESHVNTFFHIAGQVFITLLYFSVIVRYRIPICIVISKFNQTLQYQAMGCFGRKHITKIELQNAHVLFRQNSIWDRAKGWHLVAFNKYFLNKISIIENEKDGFSKQQLDDIIKSISQITGDDILNKPKSFIDDFAYFFM